MSSQTGLKHVATEPTRLESKRERRRGASGRAAALRRAPSDSDCSGETASLSADSGDRSVRPAPPPPRSGKNRSSRRRGSEWEVLEGLKDGQRFEKRPEVFNGYLHKKRKWPLKGWHKRFFVIDGGILVYARSPADVARGRLHGSVDVGLSVLSAKARRRRVDIDADEFIYHLRAKTNEVFRTWLGVLEAHRLYRQHLLTFGARESVPKIHAPLEDLPPTDTSSHETKENGLGTWNKSKFNNDYQSNWAATNSMVYNLCEVTKYKSAFESKFSENGNKVQNGKEEDKSVVNITENSIIANNTVHEIYNMNTENRYPMTSYIAKNVIDLNNKKSTVSLEVKDNVTNNIYNYKRNKTLCIGDGVETPTYFFFSKNKRDDTNPIIRKSKKSTNVVKYRNIYDEPTLKRPLSRVMLLAKYKSKEYKTLQIHELDNDYMKSITKKHIDVQTNEDKKNEVIERKCTISEYDEIAEKLMVSIITNSNQDVTVKSCINQVIRELNDIIFDKSYDHPVKKLFKCLLEYWLNNTTSENRKDLIKQSRSIHRQSNRYFSKDQSTSDVVLSKISKATQFHGISDLIKDKALEMPVQGTGKKNRLACKINDSFEKERRIQELERILKNTVYICDTVHSKQSKDKDIKITKKLIDNLDKFSCKNDLNRSDEEARCDNSSSNELPKIQETINNLIRDTDIPPNVAKDFFGAYLNLLRESHSDDSTTSTEESQCNVVHNCEVQAEPVEKKISKSISTKDNLPIPKENALDPGRLYLRDVLDKITTIFSNDINTDLNEKKYWNKIKIQDELGNYKQQESYKDNPIMLNISKYDFGDISMIDDPYIKGIASIIMKLKEKPLNSGEHKSINHDLKYTNHISNIETFKNNLLQTESCKSDEIFNVKTFKPNSVMGLPYINVQDFIDKEAKELQPYLSSHVSENKILSNEIKITDYSSLSDGTSKRYRKYAQSYSSAKATNGITDYMKTLNDEELQPCFMLSLKKGVLNSKYQNKKTTKNDERQTYYETNEPTCSYQEDISMFDKIPKVVDETHILMLLENLATLSKNIPSIYKDINNLYVKLRKKHDKMIMNSSKIQGLGLLGKIYKEESFVKATEENETQFDEIICHRAIHIARNDITTNTSKNFIRKNLIDKSVNPLAKTEVLYKSTQVDIKEDIFDSVNISKRKIFDKYNNASTTQTASFSSLSSDEEILTTDKAVSNQNWYTTVCTRECGISTLIQNVLDRCDSSGNFRLKTPQEITILNNEMVTMKRVKNERKQSPQLRQNLIREIALLSPSFKISTQSQTEKKLRCLRNKSLNKDYNIYQLFMSRKYETKKSCSMLNFMVKSDISDDLKTLYRCNSETSYISGLVSPTPTRGPQAGFVAGTPGGRLAGWILDNGSPLESVSRELGQAQLSVQQLQRLLAALELQQQQHHDTDVSLEGASPNVKKDRRKFGLRKKKSSNKCSSGDLQPGDTHGGLSSLTAPPSPGAGASPAPALAASLPLAAATRPASLPGAESPGAPAALSLTPEHQLREDFTVLAKDLVCSLKGVVATLARERSRVRAEGEGPPVMAALRTDLSTALHLNSELRARLARIHDASDLADVSCAHASRQFQQSLSYSSSCVSASEFFDAEEHEGEKDEEIINAEENVLCPQTGVIELDGDSSSEAGSLSSEEGSASSDNSDANMVTVVAEPRAPAWVRRGRLPAPRPEPGGPSLWNLLYKNIGKDLSQISMPVTINEPLNMLQRLCEELEYSELLDAASSCTDAAERASLVAAFAVSAYAAAAHRAASKPFNPLLGETYECVRDDRGFSFVAEQVSHHPPISACHASSPRWRFWQEARIKTKFWGKSMEFQPAGRVHVWLSGTGDHYSWNKVTTCVHNLFGGQRWVDQYGDMHLVCHGTDVSCKLNFVKASSWSSSRHEVRGAVSWGSRRLRLSGRWSEALHAGEPPGARCLWRPGAMPADHEAYYGFTRFATELNELEPGMAEVLPHTDTRLRPDQRALEEGDVEAAERLKHQLEQAQRERRRDSPEHKPAWFRKESDGEEEVWRFTGEYWNAREAGFPSLATPRLW